LPTSLQPRPLDATLTVTKAAKVLGVHPNTVRSWSDQGRLRYYRINDRGDRRYRVGDLQRFLAAAEQEPPPVPPHALTRDSLLRRRPMPIPSLALSRLDPSDDSEDLDLVAELAELAVRGGDLDSLLTEACRRIRMALDATLVGIWERTPDGLIVRASDSPEAPHAAPVAALPLSYGVLGRAIETGRPARTRGGDDGPLPIARLGVPEDRIVWETRSRTTRQQLTNLRDIIGSDRTVLIASRLQMPRVAALARTLSLPILLAPSSIDTEPPTSGGWLVVPTATALWVSRDALYERVALAYYGFDPELAR